MSEKAEKIKQQLQAYRAELAKYKKFFMEDGLTDQEAQAQLDRMNWCLWTISKIAANVTFYLKKVINKTE